MTVYRWRGKTRAGQEQSGEIDVASRNIALISLRRQGLLNIKIRKRPAGIHIFPEKISEREITVFFRQLSTMINAGLPLVQCFELAERGMKNKAMRKLLKGVRGGLESGSPLGKTLGKFPRHFDRLTCSLVEAGEQGGILDTILLRLSTYREKAQSLKSKVKSALTYPAAIIIIAFIVSAILLIFVIPVFAKMFADFGAELPGPTMMAIAVSNIFVQYWYAVAGAPIVLIAGVGYLRKTPRGRYAIDKLLLNLPVIGNVLRKAAVARFCRTFSVLAAAGVPIMEGLDTVARTSGNLVIEQAVFKARESIGQGQTLATPLEKSGVFPVMVTQMIGIGEETGTLEGMLAKIADFYEEEVDTAVDNMTSLLEPFIMAFLGIVIGGLVIAMYLPIFKMASVI